MQNFKKLSALLFLVVMVSGVSFSVSAQNSPEREKALRAELQVIESEIQAQQKILSQKQLEGSSIERDVSILNAKIKEAQLKIKKHNFAIENLGKDIFVKVNTIQKLEWNITKGQESLAQIMRKTNQIDDFSLPEILLGNDNLSEALIDLDAFNSLKEALGSTFVELRDAKKSNEKEKENLSQKRNQEIDTRVNVEEEQKKIKLAEVEKKRLLALNKNEQAGYKKVISDKAARAAQIRSALFSLRDSAAIPFGDALNYAKEASKVTGVSSAFVLAILTQESNLGSNVGSCYLTNLTNGDGKGKNTGTYFEQVMKAPRDTVPFVDLTQALGRDWSTTPVSCPIGSTKYYIGRGFGGAMGPAQFIPSTWVLIKNRLEKALGVAASDPWNPRHAIMASSMYLQDRGAVAGSYTSEIAAACKYYGSGGASCAYGTQVMAKVKAIQANIDILNAN